MSKPQLSNIRSTTAACFSALLGLAIYGLASQSAHAQTTCSSAMSDGPTWLEAQAHIGDTVHFQINLNAVDNVCKLIGGTNWVITPDGVSHVIVAGYSKVSCGAGSAISIQCPGGIGCISSIPNDGVYFNYTIQPGDVGRVLNFTSPRGTVLPPSFSGVPGKIHVGAVTDADAFDCNTGTPKGQAAGLGTQPFEVVTPCIQVFKTCDLLPGQVCFTAETPVRFRGYVTNCGDITLTNVTVVDNRAGNMQLINPATGLALPPPYSLAPGTYAVFSNSFLPTLQETCAGSATNVVIATATDITTIGGPRASVTNSFTDVCAVCFAPAVTITKLCPAGLVQPGGVLTYSGTVSNAGNITLTNVTVVNNQPSNNAPVVGPITLAPGGALTFTNSYTVPLDSCGPYVDTLTVRANTTCGASLTNTATASCASTNSPGIDVVKTCPAGLVQPGEVLTVTGTVTNTGNITLTNVVVTNTIAALGNVSRRVLGPISLAPGTGAGFTDSYTVPLDSCGPYVDTFLANGADKCFGRVVTDSDTKACLGTNSPSIDVVKVCPAGLIQPGQLLTVTGTVTNTGNITLNNVLVFNRVAALGNVSRQVLGPISLQPGTGTTFTDSYIVPLDSCGPYVDTFTASGHDKCFVRVVTDSDTKACPGTNSPSIDVVKACPAGFVQPGQLLTVTGTVTNTGNITLTNVVVTNTIAALGNLSRRVLGPISLAPGAGIGFSDSYTVPLDSCGPYVDTFAASGADKCFGRLVADSDTKACPGTNSPGIDVVKTCPPGLVQPGQLLTVTGRLNNTGNITLTNVVVTNTIAALGNLSRRVLGPINLAPGAATNFSDSYVVPLDSCGPYTDTFAASGADKCFGRVVTDSDTQSCPGTNSPRIFIAKFCPAVPVAPNEITTISGVVSNAGNIALTNVLVFDDQPANNTLLLGPISLAPGQRAFFTNSYLLPPNCCTYVDTVRTSGRDKCFGRTVTDSATAVCTTATNPRLTVTKVCPPLAVPLGQALVFSGVVSNAGNITLTNVTVVDSQPVANTLVLGPIDLAPGEKANFTGSFIVPNDICDTNITDTVTARGNSICNGTNVSASQSASCPILPRPLLVVTKNCPTNPVTPGGLLSYSGIVSNAGNITLTNVIVVNDRPTNNTPVLGPITLAPNQSTNFSGSYYVCPECCPPYVDTISASGAQICNGSNVSATATAHCPGVSKPQLRLIVDCPPAPALLGQLLFYSGIVSNSGDITLSSVLVSDNKTGFLIQVAALAPAETADFFGFYLATNCGPNIVTLATASAFDICTGAGITTESSTSCVIICPDTQPPKPPLLLGPQIVDGQQFKFSFATEAGRTYIVQYTDSLVPADWQSMPSFVGDGNIVTITDPAGSQRRFYRVLVQ